MAGYPAKVIFDKRTEPKRILNFNEIFKIDRVLGKGGFGEVIKVTDKVSRKSYAIKKLKQVDGSTYSEINMLITLSNYKSLRNHIVKYYDRFMYNTDFCILMEYIPGIDASKYFQTYPFGLVNFIDFGIWLTNILNELHKLGFVHRDIKPANIMVSTTSSGLKTYKLIDFGLSCRTSIINDPLKCSVSFAGTYPYMSPELLNGSFKNNINKYYKTSDMYAAGITLYNILSGRYPYQLDNFGRAIGKVYTNISTPNVSKDLNVLLNNILKGMVYINPDNRLSAAKSLQKFKIYKKRLNLFNKKN